MLTISRPGSPVSQPEMPSAAPSVDASSPNACSVAQALRHAAELTEKALGSVAIGFGLLSSGGLLYWLYRHGQPPELEASMQESTLANSPYDRTMFNHCITGHLRPANVTGVPAVIGSAGSSFHDHAGLSPADSLAQCLRIVGSLSMQNGFIRTEQALSAGRQHFPMQVAGWAACGLGVSLTLATVVPVALNHISQLLETRAFRLQERDEAFDLEAASLQAPTDAPLTFALHAGAITEKVREWVALAPTIALYETGLSMWIAVAIYMGALASGKLAHVSPDTSLHNLGKNFTNTDSLAGVAPRLAAYALQRRESLHWIDSAATAAWSFGAGVMGFVAPHAVHAIASVSRTLQPSQLVSWQISFLRNTPLIRQLQRLLLSNGIDVAALSTRLQNTVGWQAWPLGVNHAYDVLSTNGSNQRNSTIRRESSATPEIELGSMNVEPEEARPNRSEENAQP